MNKETRKTIERIHERLSGLVSELEEVKWEINDLQSDEQGKFDNLTEGLQQAESGQAIEQAANDLQEAASEMEDAISSAESAVSKLEEIA